MLKIGKRAEKSRAEERADYLIGLLWHAGVFVIINAFFWLLDIWGPGGINWSFFITVAWGFALAFHALAYWIDGRDIRGTKIREYEEQERRDD